MSQNPKRYDFYGDELDEEDEDEEADAAMVDNNPYGEVKLERMSCSPTVTPTANTIRSIDTSELCCRAPEPSFPVHNVQVLCSY